MRTSLAGVGIAVGILTAPAFAQIAPVSNSIVAESLAKMDGIGDDHTDSSLSGVFGTKNYTTSGFLTGPWATISSASTGTMTIGATAITGSASETVHWQQTNYPSSLEANAVLSGVCTFNITETVAYTFAATSTTQPGTSNVHLGGYNIAEDTFLDNEYDNNLFDFSTLQSGPPQTNSLFATGILQPGEYMLALLSGAGIKQSWSGAEGVPLTTPIDATFQVSMSFALTVTALPTPGTAGVVGLGVVAVFRRRRSRVE